jgi:hypothetical protein
VFGSSRGCRLAVSAALSVSVLLGVASTAGAQTGTPAGSSTTGSTPGTSTPGETTQPTSPESGGGQCGAFKEAITAYIQNFSDPGPNLELLTETLGPHTVKKAGLPTPLVAPVHTTLGSLFCSDSATAGAELEFVYQIKGTPYNWQGHFVAPRVEANNGSCEIRRGSVRDDYSPYKCSVHWNAGEDPSPVFAIVQKSTTVIDGKTDPNRAAQYIKQYCQTQSSPACEWDTTSSHAYVQPKGDRKQVTPVVSTCPPENKESELTYSKKVKIGWSDSIGLKTSVEATAKVPFFEDKVKAKIEGDYSHKIDASVETDFSLKKFVPVNYRGALYFTGGVVEVQGSAIIHAPDDTYKVNNVVVDFPLDNEYNPGHDQPPIPTGVLEPEYWPCSQHQPSYPPSGSPGLTFQEIKDLPPAQSAHSS